MRHASKELSADGYPAWGAFLMSVLSDGCGYTRCAVAITTVLLTVLVRTASASAQIVADAGPVAGTVTGQVADLVGAPVSGAVVTLEQEGDALPTETVSGADGRFAFVNVAAGSFRVTISAPGFAAATISGHLAPGATASLTPIRLMLSAGAVSIEVRPTRVIAEEQLKTQEQQRVFGVFQNFNVSYEANPVPLDAPQKFQLAWKNIVDPWQYVWLAGLAGIQEARHDFTGFGGDEAGYAKRYAAATATILTGTVLTKAIMPIVFKQDPRYFYKGTGSTSSRVGYALSRAIVTRSDNGHLQPDYSRILGHFTAGAISNLYYPPQDRHSLQLTAQYTALAIGAGAIDNLLQEFLLKRFTTHAEPGRRRDAGK
jgi:hypothetical protein